MMKLNDKKCRNAKPESKPYKLADGGGLYMLVTPEGGKYWRLKYRYLDREKLLSFGTYPLLSLAEAREKRDEAKKLITSGKDPSAVKKADRRQAIQDSRNTFKAVALEWHENQLDKWTPKHAVNVMRRLEIDIFPYIGSRPIRTRTCLKRETCFCLNSFPAKSTFLPPPLKLRRQHEI